ILAVAVVCFGVWMSIHRDECRKSLTLPVIGLGALILLIFDRFLGSLEECRFTAVGEVLDTEISVSCHVVLDFGLNHGIHSSSVTVASFLTCLNFGQKLKEYKLAELSPIEAGCCRPPSESASLLLPFLLLGLSCSGI
ncbi:hypothetical protein BHE74_00017494, partial [Ensete ventricosum]